MMMIMGTQDLASRLSQLVWESVTDFMEEGSLGLGSTRSAQAIVGRSVDVDEILIFFLWVHTRVVQQAFAPRYPGEVVKTLLDGMHRHVFADLEQHGMASSRLPIFEQLISARYAEYYSAAKGEDSMIGRVAALYVDEEGIGEAGGADPMAAALAQAATDAAGPLRDFLEEVQLAPAPAVA